MHKYIHLLFVISLLHSCKPTSNVNKLKEPNALINETSPYLLQHAYNPVKWHPWNDEVLAKAKKEQKLLIISIGYSACHWCHVMEHESFEDSLVASIMNEHFIPIKVDREERPDVDDVYMSACQLINNGGCGWPLNAFALPDGRPIWAGTYFPKDQWTNILNQFKSLKEDDPKKLENSAERIAQGLSSIDQIELVDISNANCSEVELDQITTKFLSNIDMEYGGRKGAPKFPMPNNYQFLLKYFHLTKNENALKAVNTTLEQMASGGIYDQLQGGFSRYSVDEKWHVPHFEKMLYDNAQLISLYSNAYKISKRDTYKTIIQQTIDFLKTEQMAKNHAFYSSYDADSEGKEGKYYVWDFKEITQIINNDSIAQVYCDYYDITPEGNWHEEQTNILKNTKPDLAQKYNLTDEELKSLIAAVNENLLQIRKNRVKPGLDDKVLTAWNGLMISALVDAFTALGNSTYLESAINTAQFIDKNMIDKNGRLSRNYKDGKVTINAFLDDYAAVIAGYLRLYEVTFDEYWINRSNELTEYVFEHFDDEKTFFYYTSDKDAPLVTRKKVLADNVIPSSNSIMARNLLKLGTFLNNKRYLNRSNTMMYQLLPQIKDTDIPNFYSNWCQLYLECIFPPYEIAILGEKATTLSQKMQEEYFTNAFFLGGEKEGSLELLQNKLQEGQNMIYVCRNKVCKFPVDNITEAKKLVK